MTRERSTVRCPPSFSATQSPGPSSQLGSEASSPKPRPSSTRQATAIRARMLVVSADTFRNPRLALPGDLGEPVPRGRRCTCRRRDKLDDGWVPDGLLSAFEARVTFRQPPLGAEGQRVKAPVIRGPVERRVVLEVNGTELGIAERVALPREPYSRLLR